MQQGKSGWRRIAHETLEGHIRTVLASFALATTVACAETREEKVDLEGKRVIFAQPGETIHFSYDVPEGFIVDKEGWSWCFAYTDGHGCTYYDDEYGEGRTESYTYEPTGTCVEFDGKGSITLSNNEMVRVELRIKKTECRLLDLHARICACCRPGRVLYL